MAYRTVRPSSLPSLESRKPDELLTCEETAAYLGFSLSTLEKWRSGYRGIYGGPPWISMHDGEKAPIRYMVTDVRTWLNARRTTPEDTPAEVA
jgi:hypothetical protein